MVTVALESWLYSCWLLSCKSPLPSRGGFVRLCADATRVFDLQKSSFQSVRINIVFRASNQVLLCERVKSKIFAASRDLFGRKVSGPPSFLVSAVLCSE
jgi:hypothetical protein